MLHLTSTDIGSPLNSNGRLAVLASYSAESDAKVTSFAVIVLREDAIMTDNMVVENSVLLDYCENVSQMGSEGPSHHKLIVCVCNLAGSSSCALFDSIKAWENGICQVRACRCNLLTRGGYVSRLDCRGLY